MRVATRNRVTTNPEKGFISWFRPDGTKAFENGQIPAALRTDADAWMRRTIAPDLLPSDLRSRFRGARQEGDDWIFARFRTPRGERLQVAEYTNSVFLTIRGDESLENLTEVATADFVKAISRRALRLTDEQIRDAQFTCRIWRDPRPKGYARGTFTIGPAVEIEHRSWWSSITFITDGECVLLGIRKVMPGLLNSNTAGADPLKPYRPRFGG